MSPRTRKVLLKTRRIKKLRYKKVVTILPQQNVAQVKPTSQFQELSVGMVIPSALGSYKILSELAIGRCCEVYIGENLSTKTQDAIKVFIRQQHYKGALLRELKFVAKLSPHLHIVTAKSSVKYEGRDILIHELLSGTLKDILAMHEGRLPSIWLVATLATHLMRGLSHIHREGVVHGDLKPHNIMWSGDEGTFKLIDFGVSFSTKENMEHAVQSRAYQAPETVLWNEWVQLKGTAGPPGPSLLKPGPPVDVWSAGCIVAEVLTGGKMFPFGWSDSGGGGGEVEEALRNAFGRMEEGGGGGARQEFAQRALRWIRRCLSEDVESRSTAEECAEEECLVAGLCERPSLFDLVSLPTPVVRVLGLVRPEMEHHLAYDLIESVIEKASTPTPPSEHALDGTSGSLFLRYDSAQASEAALVCLKRAAVGGYTLVVTFFPLSLYEERSFF